MFRMRDFYGYVRDYIIVLPECISCVQFVKCGYAGDNFPAAVFPCLVGRPMLRYEENLGERELRVSF